MTEVTIHGFAPSTYVRTARMACIEKGIDHDLAPLAFGEPEHFALHPFGKMPVLTCGDVTVFETVAIIAFLDRMRPDDPLIPVDPMLRVRTLTALSVAVDYAYRPLVFTAQSENGPDLADMAKVARVLDWLDTCLRNQEFVASPNCAAADLTFAPMLGHHLKECGDAHVFQDRKALRRWFSAITARRSYVDAAG